MEKFEIMVATRVTKEEIGSFLKQVGYSANVSHKAESVLFDAEKEGYVRFFLIKPGECLLCGSRNIPDLLVDVYMPNKEKTVYIHAICKADRAEAEYVRGDDSEINERIRDEMGGFSDN